MSRQRDEREEQRVPVTDKRRTARAPEDGAGAGGDPAADVVESAGASAAQEEAADHDYLEDLKRLQAEFDNYRKRVLREQTAMAERASERMVAALLPVLDNLERAVEHGEGEGIELVYKDFRKVLEDEGLEEIGAAGVPFDPSVHEAVESHEEEGVDEPVVRKVYRKGYSLRGKVLRAPMVVVARPAEGPREAEG